MVLETMREQVLAIAREHGATRVRVFGSVARGDATEDSDVDLLVDLDRGRGLLDVCGITADLRELLGRRVDVVTEESLNWLLRRRILREARPL
ncbi:MAG: nucleotidyltransferase family protein [Phycisphaerales bacterium]|nr:nucleotidyltransferase family protein [Phycisphaerales bacterium]